MSQSEEQNRLMYFKTLVGKSLRDSQFPIPKWLEGILVEVEEGRMVAEFLVRPDMTNPMGTLHGGVASMILDDLCGTLVYSLGDPNVFTSVNLNCDFLNPAFIGDRITAVATVIRRGKNIVHCHGEITDKNGSLIAKCTTNLIRISIKSSSK